MPFSHNLLECCKKCKNQNTETVQKYKNISCCFLFHRKLVTPIKTCFSRREQNRLFSQSSSPATWRWGWFSYKVFRRAPAAGRADAEWCLHPCPPAPPPLSGSIVSWMLCSQMSGSFQYADHLCLLRPLCWSPVLKNFCWLLCLEWKSPAL